MSGEPAAGAFPREGAMTYTWHPRRAAPTSWPAHSGLVQIESGEMRRVSGGDSV
jgi:hypothetical protein